MSTLGTLDELSPEAMEALSLLEEVVRVKRRVRRIQSQTWVLLIFLGAVLLVGADHFGSAGALPKLISPCGSEADSGDPIHPCVEPGSIKAETGSSASPSGDVTPEARKLGEPGAKVITFSSSSESSPKVASRNSADEGHTVLSFYGKVPESWSAGDHSWYWISSIIIALGVAFYLRRSKVNRFGLRTVAVWFGGAAVTGVYVVWSQGTKHSPETAGLLAVAAVLGVLGAKERSPYLFGGGCMLFLASLLASHLNLPISLQIVPIGSQIQVYFGAAIAATGLILWVVNLSPPIRLNRAGR